MALQWLKQPDGTLVLWDTAKGGAPLTASPEGKQAMPGTDTTDTARQMFEDKQGTKPPSPFDALTKDQTDVPPTTGDPKIDFNALINAILSKPGELEGGQSVGTAEQASPAEPTTGEEAKASVGKTKDYPGAEPFVQGLVKRGWTPEEAAAAAGNAHVESGFRPGIKSSVKNEQSFGFLQWNKERLQGLKNMSAAKGMDWQDPEAQLDWINMERSGESTKYGGGSEKSSYEKAFKGGGSPSEMAARFGKYVERPKDLSQSVNQRMAAADSYLKYAHAHPNMPVDTAVAQASPMQKPQPYSDGKSMDEEMFSSILGQGGTSWG